MTLTETLVLQVEEQLKQNMTSITRLLLHLSYGETFRLFWLQISNLAVPLNFSCKYSVSRLVL